ncbi:FkbM family methyltransferase [Rhabdochromatium marinum]|uniref:FkbM family methyltransferase n=1 Tax=Rhabdochromatium marinum TaxID=48729 RepID=UPI0019044AFB|nr:FkbM family methyltransferase [Rhabdochromatium marinum]MBK1648840.1 FkbM family methyltransferase [Rhabdochromatium marinum]
MKKLIKRVINLLGWDIHVLTPASNPSVQLLAALSQVQSNLVFDIGANIGQFAQELRSAGFRGKIISFEPLSIEHEKLCKAARKDAAWWVHPRAAVGDHDGKIEINIAANSVSSSVLPMLDSHLSAALDSSYVAVESTPLIQLDSVAAQYLDNTSQPFIKIDTQGFEWQVLDGAADTLKRAQGVLLELSLVPLYDGQRLWREMIDRMEAEGFTLWSIHQSFIDLHTGQSLQVDAIFLRQYALK